MITISLPHNRIKTIVEHPEAVGREALAEHLARETIMTPDEAVAALRAAPRAGDATGAAAGAAATASAAVARALLGLPSDPAADLAIGQSIANAHAAEVAEQARAAAQRAQDEKDYAEGRAAAERLRGRRH